MIKLEALFKVSYGLYIITSGFKDLGNAYISNTFFQVTAEPSQFAASCNKDNFTTGFIQKNGTFSVSVLKKDASQDIIKRLGYRSGKDFNKLEGLDIKYGQTGVPIILNEAIAIFEFKVNKTLDVGTHLLFIADLLNAELLEDTMEPLTYSHYREARKAFSPKNSPTYIDEAKLITKPADSKYKLYRCTTCGYIYNEAIGDPTGNIKPGTLFSELPDDWVCPVCGTPKEGFVEV
jgi:rubredoxin/flavin reductase (DIM6/NTAB) family NADH-FMN oxidoreductase RutF